MFFEIKPDHVIDVITNSSSELFVLKGQTKEIVAELVKSIYPDYENEYRLISSDEMTLDDWHTYMNYKVDTPWEMKKDDPKRLAINCFGFEFDELFEYREWGNADKKYGSYHIRNTITVEKFKETLDPLGVTFFLFSLGENPDCDMQEKLSEIGERYHLG